MMLRKFALILAVALAAGVCGLAEPAVLTVHGSGTVTMLPDMAFIGFGVSKSSTNIAEAQAYVNETMGKIIEQLRGMGVKEEDIQTSSISIHEDYDYDSSSVLSKWSNTAYVVENSVSVRFTDLQNAGQYIDAVFQAGANSFTGISFSASDDAEERARALELAVTDARTRAETLAAAAGMKLGALQTMTDGAAGGYVEYGMDKGLVARAEAANESFANLVFTTELQVSATVTAQYELKPVEQ